MKTIINDQIEACRLAAESIKQLISDRPDAVIAVSAEHALHGVWDALVKMNVHGELCLADTRFFLLAEFSGSDICRNEIKRSFLDRTDAKEGNCFFLSDENAADCEERIAALGGLDMAILSLGSNGRIGFNEPATPYESLTHIQRLAPATRRELAECFHGEENVPAFGITLGIKTITSAKNILVAAFGAQQAKPVFNMLYGRNDSVVPAAFLQIPMNVAVYLDREAAQKL